LEHGTATRFHVPKNSFIVTLPLQAGLETQACFQTACDNGARIHDFDFRSKKFHKTRTQRITERAALACHSRRLREFKQCLLVVRFVGCNRERSTASVFVLAQRVAQFPQLFLAACGLAVANPPVFDCALHFVA
jgi:hypothetical protein